jgi:hypothetical protein
LLLQEQGGQLHLLPALPSDFVCGKAFFLQTLQGHEVYLEWTKHLMRTVCIRVQKEDTILCRFPREVKRFRLKKHGKDRGYKVETDQEIPVQKGDVLWMDRFEK